MAWTIGCLFAVIFITLMWHSIDPAGDFWLSCAGFTGVVLLAVVAIQYWMVVIPVVLLAGLVGTVVWYIRQPQTPTPTLARAGEGQKN